MLWFSGLRGAVSYALVRTFPQTGNEQIFIVTTVMIVLLTTFVLGGSTEWALRKLDIPVGVDEVEYLRSLRQKRLLFGWLHRFESSTLRSWVIRDFRQGDNAQSSDTNGDGITTLFGLRVPRARRVDRAGAYSEYQTGHEQCLRLWTMIYPNNLLLDYFHYKILLPFNYSELGASAA